MLSGPGCCSPRRRLPGGASSRYRKVGRHRRCRHCQQASHGVGRRCPACGVHPSGFGVRDPAVQPSGVRSPGVVVQSPALGRLLSTHPASSRPLSSRLVSAPSVRTRPSPPTQALALGPGRAGRATVTTGTGGGPVAAGPSTARSTVGRPGRGRRCPRRVGHWEVAGGPGPPGWVRAAAAALAHSSDQAGPAGGAPVAGGCAVGTGAGCSARWRPRRVAGVLGWVGDHGGWSSPSLPPGWADPEGPLEVPAGMGVRPQRGPSRQRARPARCRQRCDLRR
jgi:hypothetical protein